MNDYYLFQKVIQHDIENANEIIDSSEILILRDTSVEVVVYNRANNFIVRKVGVLSDTFDLKNTEWTIQKFSDSIHLVKYVLVTTSIGDQKLSSFFEKQYSASELMKIDYGQ